ncbi:hypothetical protein BGE01nite_39670 [Brevifollis gellanilyticus]|uniref:Uncharacterized protein n=2 Tax=Brevifollis gellanilyticus TaxID=748831 RepID=A0A512MD73_9BACT|nr:hypothetical protein BGE01nite_39670 [Brevifollis gellanilyticus]
MRAMTFSRGLLSVLALMLPAFASAADPFAIHVIDESTGRGVPLVTLTTTNHIAHITDSAGWIAFNEPGLMEREVFFHVVSPGYAAGKDGFGYAGVRLTPKAGATVEVKVMRMNIAERLYRITGQGIYRDSELLAKPAPLPRPNFNFVMGQDSVQAVPFHGRLFWLWGDTNVAHYPLGSFHSTCAWSDLPEKGGLNPDEGVHLEYLTSEDGKLRKMMPTKEPGVVWIFGMLVVADSEGKEHLLGHYGRFKDLGKRLEHGLCEFDESQGIFVSSTLLGDEFEWQHPEGNAFRVKNDEGEFFYFSQEFAVTRVPATYNDVLNPGSYEALAWSETEQDYVWQKKLPPVTQKGEAKMLADKKLPADRALLQVQDALTGKPVAMHRSSVNWNPHRKAWIMIGSQHFAPESVLGEVWYAEAPTPSGPWTKAVKVASHPRYTFYNPRHHVLFDQQGGRIIHFEGTYTETFSGNPVPTPRYDYNQLMYRLDLDDPRLEVLRKAVK